jgi:hypothetical protein
MNRWLAPIGGALVGAMAGGALVLATGPPADPTGEAPPEPRPPAPSRLSKAPTPTLLAWTPGRLPDGFAERVRAVPQVRRVAVVRSGVVWMSAWRDRGEPFRTPPAGYRIPVEVAAVGPAQYAPFVPPGDRPAVRGLAGGGTIMGETGAGLRGAGSGGRLRFGGTTLRVEAVLADELVGAHEVVVSRNTGERLGVNRPRYLLVQPASEQAAGRVERALRRAVAQGQRLRVRAPGETPFFRHGDAVLPPSRLKALFGEFAARPGPGGTIVPEPGWVRANVRTARVPILGEARCHRRLLPLVRGALGDLARRGLSDLVDASDYGGCYSPRFANRDPDGGLSHHAWGIAIDLNVSGNGLGQEPRLDRRVVEVLERWGFTWGGRWLIPDGMHFEFLRYPGPG